MLASALEGFSKFTVLLFSAQIIAKKPITSDATATTATSDATVTNKA